jgi:ELWxxDGT repeat protein
MKPTHLLVASTLAALCSSAVADPVAAQPIGLIDKKNVAITEPSDFFTLPGKFGSRKLLFTAKVKDLGVKGEQRALFVQDILAKDLVTPYFKVSQSPLKKLATYKVATGTKFDSFVKATGNFGNSSALRLKQMFFHVPGVGLYVTEGGAAPKVVRLEKATDPSTAISPGALLLSDYINNNSDPELQSRFFFTAKDPKKGREPFLYGGKTSLLKDIYPATGEGSDPIGYAAVGPQNSTQKLYFLAASPNDGNTYQLWRANRSIERGKAVYDAFPFTTGANAILSTPANLVANGSDLFYTAPTATSNGVPELWHLRANGNNTVNDLESLTTGGRDPQQLTFNSKDTSLTVLAFTVLDGGVRRYARYSYFNNNVTILGVAQGISNPQTITDAGQEYYFNGTYTDGFTYLIKHYTSDNDLEYVRCSVAIPGGFLNYIYNVGEICAASASGTAGFVYFTASAYVDGAYRNNILFKIAANEGPALAAPVRTPQGNLVTNAKNLRDVVDNASPGFFRLYFAAPVSNTENSEFLPAGSTVTDYGYKPWVTSEQ